MKKTIFELYTDVKLVVELPDGGWRLSEEQLHTDTWRAGFKCAVVYPRDGQKKTWDRYLYSVINYLLGEVGWTSIKPVFLAACVFFSSSHFVAGSTSKLDIHYILIALIRLSIRYLLSLDLDAYVNSHQSFIEYLHACFMVAYGTISKFCNILFCI